MTVPLQRLTDSLSLYIALAIVAVWAFSLWNCLQIQLENCHPFLAICLVGWQTWIYTGLFITAHDAMHGSIHSSPAIDRTIGRICLWVYAGFDYSQLALKHHLHHHYPASDRDPDFHDGEKTDFWSWYGHFVCEHISWRQLSNLVVLLGIYLIICQFSLAQPLPGSIANLGLFWIVPSVLSSLQLFYFGTFLPHREPPGGYTNPHRAHTIDRSRLWSLITCYHFGYHREHHESPQLSWWQLGRL